MDPLTIAAAAGIRARMESLELLANNIANASTAGFKADREFYDLYLGDQAGGGPETTRLPLIEREWTDFSQGVLKPTMSCPGELEARRQALRSASAGSSLAVTLPGKDAHERDRQGHLHSEMQVERIHTVAVRGWRAVLDLGTTCRSIP